MSGIVEHLVITIDVECDYDGSSVWRYPDPLTYRAVLEGIPGRLQPLFESYGARPTYLVSNVVLEDDACAGVLAALPATCELGTHLHGEYIEPEKTFSRYGGTKNWENQSQYGLEIERGKMANLKALFEERFGRPPKSFRAGRFSAGKNTVPILAELGYRVDTSVTPHMIWQDRTRRLSFEGAPEQPYFPGREEITATGELPVLEVPVSIVRKTFFRRRHLWLRHTFATLPEMIAVMKDYRRRHRRAGRVVYNMMFHNVEVYPGASIHTPDEKACRDFLGRIEGVLEWCASFGVAFSTLSDLYDIYRDHD